MKITITLTDVTNNGVNITFASNRVAFLNSPQRHTPAEQLGGEIQRFIAMLAARDARTRAEAKQNVNGSQPHPDRAALPPPPSPQPPALPDSPRTPPADLPPDPA